MLLQHLSKFVREPLVPALVSCWSSRGLHLHSVLCCSILTPHCSVTPLSVSTTRFLEPIITMLSSFSSVSDVLGQHVLPCGLRGCIPCTRCPARQPPVPRGALGLAPPGLVCGRVPKSPSSATASSACRGSTSHVSPELLYVTHGFNTVASLW